MDICFSPFVFILLYHSSLFSVYFFSIAPQGRILKQSNGLEFFYDTTGIVGIKYYSVNYVYRKDVQGNIIAILDSSGNVVVKYHYDAWGNHTITDSNGKSVTNGIGVSNPFRYRGYYYDTETKLYYLQTRYYDPEVGRFINIDNIEYADPETINGLNLYAYCNNNPVNYYDPSGQVVITIGIGFGLAIAGVGAALLAWIEATFHPIENAVKDVGILMGDVVGDLINEININSSTNNIGSNGITSSNFGASEVIIINSANLYNYTISFAGISLIDTLHDLQPLVRYFSPHRSNQRPSNKNKHQEGERKRKKDKPGGEKGDERRPYRRNGKKTKHSVYMCLELLNLVR